MKSAFLTELDARTVSDKLIKLLAPLRYYSKLLGKAIEVPAGFPSDGASVPRLPIVFLLVGGKAKRAATINDFLYQTHFVKSRRKADLIFLEAMKVDGISLWARELMYAGVRTGGHGSWTTGPSRYAELQRLIK